MPAKPTIVWFRRDLRIDDNPAWNWAIRKGGPIIALYIHAPSNDGVWQRGGASNWWLHHAYKTSTASSESMATAWWSAAARTHLPPYSKLSLAQMPKAVCWNRCYEPAYVKRDTAIKQALQASGIETHSTNGSLLLDPHIIKNKSGNPFQVFTPFWKHTKEHGVAQPETLSLASTSVDIESEPLDSLELLPNIPWDKGMESFWDPTRKGGLKLLDAAIAKSKPYNIQRDLPDADGTSRLSPYLHFGQISPQEFFPYHTQWLS